MNTDRLLSHFERISDAPDAVDRLRRFILDLAVRGKLVEQDEREGTDALLHQIATQRPSGSARATQAALARSIRFLERHDGPWLVPHSWRWVRFGDIVYSRDAERIPVSKEERSHLAKNYDYYGASGVIDKIDRYLFDKPLLLIGEDGANLLNRSTPIAFMARGCYWVNNHAHVLDGISEDFLRYLEVFINATDLRPYVTGTAQPKMNQAKMNAIPVALPPMAEQHRIVEKVDELMLLCDRLEASQAEREGRRDRLVMASLNRLSQPTDPDEFKKDARFQLSNLNRLSTKPEHIKGIRKAILNLAVRGKLVPQEATLAKQEERSYESATELVVRLSEHPNRRKAAHQRTDKQELSSLPDLPNGWAWTTMPEIGELNRGRSRHRPRNEKRLYGGPYPFIQTGDVRRSLGTIRNYDQTYSEMGLSQSRMWPKNTLCITIAANIAETGILTFDACFPDSVVGFRYEDSELPVRYLEYFVRTAKERLSDFAPATAQKNINLDVLANVHVPLPPLSEQKRIVTKVDELMLICDQLETQLEYQQKGRRQLLETLLHEALEGVG
jgi:type I restriction enzyme S subunit